MPSVTPVVRDTTTGLLRNMQAGETLNAATSLSDTRQGQSAESSVSMSGGMPVIVNGAGKHLRAIATSVSAGKAVALVADASIAANGTGSFTHDGIVMLTTAQWDAITGQTGGLTPGADYFVSPTTAGYLTTTPPTTAGTTVITKVGTAFSATELDVTIHDPFLN